MPCVRISRTVLRAAATRTHCRPSRTSANGTEQGSSDSAPTCAGWAKVLRHGSRSTSRTRRASLVGILLLSLLSLYTMGLDQAYAANRMNHSIDRMSSANAFNISEFTWTDSAALHDSRGCSWNHTSGSCSVDKAVDLSFMNAMLHYKIFVRQRHWTRPRCWPRASQSSCSCLW